MTLSLRVQTELVNEELRLSINIGRTKEAHGSFFRKNQHLIIRISICPVYEGQWETIL